MIEYRCFKCGEPMESPEGSIGEPEQCPACGARRWVPDKSFRGSLAPPIGGWLILPAIGMVLSPLLAAWGLWTIHQQAGFASSIGSDRGTLSFFRGLFWLQSAWLVLICYCGWAFFGNQRKVPVLMVVMLSTQVALAFIVAVWSHSIFGYTDAAMRNILVAIAVAAGWIPYFCLSKRVRQTFVND